MALADEADLPARLTSVVHGSAWLMPALAAARSLGLASRCTGAKVPPC